MEEKLKLFEVEFLGDGKRGLESYKAHYVSGSFEEILKYCKVELDQPVKSIRLVASEIEVIG